MSECIFCKIIEGDIPSYSIYEDELFKVILDRFPASVGHCLIIPKAHYENVFDMPEELLNKVYGIAQKIAKLLKEVLGCEGINMVQNNGVVAGQSVMHFHMHLIPRSQGDKLVLNNTSHPDTTLEQLMEIAQKLKAAL